MNPFVLWRKQLAAKAEAAQIAAGDPYADLDEVRALESSRGVHFLRDGGRVVGLPKGEPEDRTDLFGDSGQ